VAARDEQGVRALDEGRRPQTDARAVAPSSMRSTVTLTTPASGADAIE
jgi:hypothetical protein